jgi:hypothetical protein
MIVDYAEVCLCKSEGIQIFVNKKRCEHKREIYQEAAFANGQRGNGGNAAVIDHYVYRMICIGNCVAVVEDHFDWKT